MDSNNILIIALMVVFLIGFIAFTFINKQSSKEPKPAADPGYSRQLQLQAYERLTLLVDRIALPNLIPRVNVSGISAREMQMLLTKNIREEFDHNITQQIYVSPEAWNAVKNLKEQNMLVVNQFTAALPPNATGLDLNKHLLEYLMTDKKGTLHEIVGEVLSFEAKKVL